MMIKLVAKYTCRCLLSMQLSPKCREKNKIKTRLDLACYKSREAKWMAQGQNKIKLGTEILPKSTVKLARKHQQLTAPNKKAGMLKQWQRYGRQDIQLQIKLKASSLRVRILGILLASLSWLIITRVSKEQAREEILLRMPLASPRLCKKK